MLAIFFFPPLSDPSESILLPRCLCLLGVADLGHVWLLTLYLLLPVSVACRCCIVLVWGPGVVNLLGFPVALGVVNLLGFLVALGVVNSMSAFVCRVYYLSHCLCQLQMAEANPQSPNLYVHNFLVFIMR